MDKLLECVIDRGRFYPTNRRGFKYVMNINVSDLFSCTFLTLEGIENYLNLCPPLNSRYLMKEEIDKYRYLESEAIELTKIITGECPTCIGFSGLPRPDGFLDILAISQVPSKLAYLFSNNIDYMTLLEGMYEDYTRRYDRR